MISSPQFIVSRPVALAGLMLGTPASLAQPSEDTPLFSPTCNGPVYRVGGRTPLEQFGTRVAIAIAAGLLLVPMLLR